MNPAVSILALLGFGFLGCKESVETTKASPEIANEIHRIQVENALSDDEISVALERWVEMYSGAKDLLESEDLFGGGAWTPERFAEMMAESERALKGVRHEDQMLAVYSLAHLSALNGERYDDIAESLRRIVTEHYASIKDNPNEVEENFVRKVHELANMDPELKRLLDQNKIGEQQDPNRVAAPLSSSREASGTR